MNKNHIVPAVMRQAAISAIFIAVWALVNVKSDIIFTGYYFTIIIYAAASMLLNYAFTLKKRSMSVIICFNVVLAAAAAFILYVSGMLVSTGAIIFMLASIIVAAYMCISTCIYGLRLSSLTICLEILLALSVFYIAVAASESVSLSAAAFLIIAVLADIFGLVFYRAEANNRTRSVLISLVIMALSVLAAFIIYEAVFYSESGIWASIWNTVSAGINAVVNVIKAFLLWLGRNVKPDEFEELELEYDGLNASTAGLSGSIDIEVPGWLTILVFALVAALVIFAVILLTRHKKFGINKKASAEKQIVINSEKTDLKDAFALMLEKLKQKREIKKFLKEHKNDACGRFYGLVNSVRNSKLAKKTGETPEEFISRYLASLKAGDKRLKEYEKLADEVNDLFYRV